jgi:tetratricopeptide (TPR) repeat protein
METGKAASANTVDHLKSGNTDSNAVVDDFERALVLASDNLEMLHSLAATLLSKGRLEEARAVYRKILDHEETNIKAMLALSRIDRRLGDNRAACNRLHVATKISPDNLHVLTDLAAVLRDLDRPDEATSIYQQILVKNADHAPSHMGLGWIARAVGNDEAAVAHFTVAHRHLREANAADPNNLHILTQLATALRGMNRPEEATPIYQQILTRDPRQVQSHMGLGWIARAGGNDEAALTHFKAAAELDPIDLQVQITLGKVHCQIGRFEEAEMIFRAVAMQVPKHGQVHASLGTLARKRNDWPAALEEFHAAVESDPKNVPFRMHLVRTLCELERWEEAEQIYRSVLEDSPRNLEALIGLGTVAKALGDLSTALAWFEQASAVAPLDLRPKREIRHLKSVPGAYDWQTEIEEAIAVTHAEGLPVETQLDAARILVEYGLTEAARPVVSRLEARFPAARQLLLAVRQIDRMGAARPLPASSPDFDPAESQLESLLGFLEMPVPGSDTILIVFGGTNNRVWITFSLLHRILRKTGVTVIYCRDLQRVWYASGIVGLGHDFQSTVGGFQALVARYGATRVLTLGNCIGCLGALRYGLSLRAQGVLALSPKLRFKPTRQPRPVEDRNIHREYLEVSSRPNVALIFGARCVGDAYNANVMSDVPGVTLAGIPDSSDTDSVKDLLVRGLFEPLLQDFVANGVVSQEMQTLISTSRNPS